MICSLFGGNNLICRASAFGWRYAAAAGIEQRIEHTAMVSASDERTHSSGSASSSNGFGLLNAPRNPKRNGDQDGSSLLGSPCASISSPSLPPSDSNEGYKVKEALRAQMEVQRKLHLQVEVEKHMQIRQDAELKYVESMLERACKLLSEQSLESAVAGDEGKDISGLGRKKSSSAFCTEPYNFHSSNLMEAIKVHNHEDESTGQRPLRADCSTESCLTSHGSPATVSVETCIPGGKKRVRNLGDHLIWS